MIPTSGLEMSRFVTGDPFYNRNAGAPIVLGSTFVLNVLDVGRCNPSLEEHRNRCGFFPLSSLTTPALKFSSAVSALKPRSLALEEIQGAGKGANHRCASKWGCIC